MPPKAASRKASAAPSPSIGRPAAARDVQEEDTSVSAPLDTAEKTQRHTQAERRRVAEQRVLDAAMEIVARRGSVRMTLAEVGEAAGYSRGLPAHYFGNKAGLLKALVQSIGARFEAHRLKMAPRQPGMDSLRGQVLAYFKRDDKRWIETRALLVMLTEGFMEDSDVHPHIADYVRGSIAATERHIRDGIDRGEIRSDLDPTITATLLVGTLRGSLHQRLVLGDLNLAGFSDMALQIVERTLEAPGANLAPKLRRR